ncbi:MAG: ATP-binding protein [Armatimonadota bacterium]
MLLRPERADLTEIIRLTLEDQQPALDRGGLLVSVSLPEAPVGLVGDPVRLSQAVGNLIHNAIKFTDPGGRIFVSLSVEPAGSDGASRAVLAVRDNGIGIAPDLLPRLFDTFSQADRSLDRSGGGLGLGLSLVKGLTELHGGTVEVESAGLGQGSEFRICLPVPREAPGPAETPVRPPERVDASPPRSGAPAARALRVLVVEDNRDAADTLQDLLEIHGHEVHVAFTGAAGVTVAQELRPDVILCDVGLPGKDGYEVARELRANPITASVRLIAVSGYGQLEDRVRAREAGFDLHLTKPVDPAELVELIRRGGEPPEAAAHP